MPIDPLPSISRSDANFRTQVDDYFLTRLPAFSTQAEAARGQIVAAESTATSAASTAATAASTATTAAGTATSASSAAVAAKNAAEAAAANAISTPVAAPINAATAKTTPADADELGITDSAASWGLKKLTFANLKAWIGSLFVSKSGDTINGNLNFSGAGRRITGNFSGASIADRLLFQSNVPNGATAVFAIPNGSEVISNFSAVNNSDTANAAIAQMSALGGEVRFSSFASGIGTVVPMTFHVGPAGERLRIDTTGNVLVTGGGGLGYGVGSGGTATQTGSRTSGVPLNKPSGQITLVSAAGTTAWQSFTVTNSAVASTDTPIVAQISGTDLYEIHVTAVATGSFRISFRTTGGTTTEQPVFKFEVHKGAAS